MNAKSAGLTLTKKGRKRFVCISNTKLALMLLKNSQVASSTTERTNEKTS
jgi:hypothetical protein